MLSRPIRSAARWARGDSASRRWVRRSSAAILAALSLTPALAGCGGGSGASGSSTSAAAAVGSPSASSSPVSAARLSPPLQGCLTQWNALVNQQQRFAFNGEAGAVLGTPRARMLLTRLAGNCVLVFAGPAGGQGRIWTLEVGSWTAQQIYPTETALKALANRALAHPNVRARLTAKPDDRDPALGTLVAL